MKQTHEQKLISIMQSRIAKRKQLIKKYWLWHSIYVGGGWYDLDQHYKELAIGQGIEQKQDKQIMKALVQAEVEIKKWKNAFAKADLMLYELQREG